MSADTIDELLVKPIRWVNIYVQNPRKLMLGADWPLTSLKPYLNGVARAIPEEQWNDVFYANASRVFGFDKVNNAPQKLELKKLADGR